MIRITSNRLVNALLQRRASQTARKAMDALRRQGGPVGAVSAVAVTLVTLWSLAGCGGQYKQGKLGSDSPEHQAVQAMLDTLRSDGTDAAMGAAAADLTKSERTSLRATLDELAKADKVELLRVDAFGPDVLRATFRVTKGARNTDVAILLVRPDEKGPYWAGRN